MKQISIKKQGFQDGYLQKTRASVGLCAFIHECSSMITNDYRYVRLYIVICTQLEIYVIKECCHIAESVATITSPPWHPHAWKDCSCKVSTSSAVNVSISYSFLYWSALCLCEFLLVYLSRSCVVAFFFQLKSMVFAQRATLM